MLNQKRSKERARLKMLFVLPIMGGMLCASTMAFTKDYAMVDLYPAQYTTGDLPLQDTTKTKMSKIKMHKQVPPPPPTPPLAPPPPPVEPAPKKVKQPKAQMPKTASASKKNVIEVITIRGKLNTEDQPQEKVVTIRGKLSSRDQPQEKVIVEPATGENKTNSKTTPMPEVIIRKKIN